MPIVVSGLPKDRLVSAITAIIDFYKANAKGKEKFGKFVDRVTPEELLRILNRASGFPV